MKKFFIYFCSFIFICFILPALLTKLEVPANDTSCMNQNTNGTREITLITCNTIKGTRIVIKAKEK